MKTIENAKPLTRDFKDFPLYSTWPLSVMEIEGCTREELGKKFLLQPLGNRVRCGPSALTENLGSPEYQLKKQLFLFECLPIPSLTDNPHRP
jgi:hypothetical protein